MCAGNELFFVALYLMKWVHTPIFSLTIRLFAHDPIVITWPFIIAVVCSPVFLTKNIINMVQLWKASKILVGVDLIERQERAREEEEKRKTRGKGA
jgi:CDP-diacylglycerol--inositol 3-phosphatidyltransferase